jgi:uncharacterized protein YdiU (UPF0061 family)
MNTDNTSIAGETLDYGPCAFLDEYDPNKKFSSIDTGGRYAFRNQPRIALWNLARLAETLLPLLADDEAEAVRIARACLDRFPRAFEAAHGAIVRAKLGLALGPEDEEGDLALAADLLARLAGGGVDFTRFFRLLCASAEDAEADQETAALFADPGAFHEWAERWRARLAREPTASVTPAARAAAMRRVNPAFIPRNSRIEEVISAAVAEGDFGPFESMLDVVTQPYDDRASRPDLARFAEPPSAAERVTETFCGT